MRDINCTKCKLSSGCQSVCLLGNYSTDVKSLVMVIIDSPSREDDECDRAYSSKYGQSVHDLLSSAGIQDYYYTYAVHCRKPGDKDPTKTEINACRYWLQKEIELVKPKFILLLGNVALQSALEIKGIKKARGKPLKVNDIVYMPTYSISNLLYDPALSSVVEADLSTFSSLIQNGGLLEEESLNLRVVNDDETFDEMMNDLKGVVSFDIETTGLYPWDNGAEINFIGFGTKNFQWSIPLAKQYSLWGYRNRKAIVRELTDKLQDCILVAHNGKFDMLWMKVHYKVDWYLDFDTMMAHYSLDENSQHGLKYLATIYCGAPSYDIGGEDKISGTLEVVSKYHGLDLLYTLKLYSIFSKRLAKEPKTKRVFDKIIMPCVRLFITIEYYGIYIDLSKMQDAEDYLKNELTEALKVLEKWGPGTNWNSPKQLGELLYDKLNIPVVSYTPKGGRATSESVIKQIDHPMCASLLRYREASKQLSAFIEGWKPFIVDSTLHPSFKLHGTVTGRLSCERPNLQQVPRDPRIRSLITAPEGWQLIDADLSQIELRVAAEVANETTMLHAFATGVDVHWLTLIRELGRQGSQPELIKHTATCLLKKYDVLPDKPLNYGEAIQVLLKYGPEKSQEFDKGWKELRKKAKAINFGFLYGMWWVKFKDYARDNYGVTVTDDEARASRDAFFELYPKFLEWHNEQKSFAKRYGYVESLIGRKRRLPEAKATYDTPGKKEAERQAINSPVQSFANDLNLMTALQISREYGVDKVRVIGTVHDATMFLVKDEYVEEVYNRILQVMSGPDLLEEFGVDLRVPILGEAQIGPWSKGVSLEKWKSK